MNGKNTVSFTLKAKIRGQEVTPETIPFSLFNKYNSEVEQLILGSEKKVLLDDIHADIQNGSYKLVVALPLMVMDSLNADLEKLKHGETLDLLDAKRASIIETWQQAVSQDSERIYEISPAWNTGKAVTIHSQTHYRKSGKPQLWVQVEKYLIGEITDMGGTSASNIHLRLDETGRVYTLKASQEFIRSIEENPVYKRYRTRVKAEQNLDTGELRAIEIIELGKPFNPRFDADKLNRLIAQATPRWADMQDANAWLHDMRGGNDD